MKSIPIPGYWELLFHGEKKPMRADKDFLSNFKPNFLEEVKRMRCGFMDIPVGDFKVSHLQEHPDLHVHGLPTVHFMQSDGEDLCVSMSLASVLFVLGFTEEAIMVDKYGKSELVGGTVDAIEKVGQFAQSKLPERITRKFLKNAHLFVWKSSYKSRCKVQSYWESSMNPMVMHLMQLPFIVTMCTMPMKW